MYILRYFSSFFNFKDNVVKKIIFLFFGLSFFLVFLVYQRWGPSLSTDTFYYFNLAKDVKSGVFPFSSSNSPGYPAFLALVSSMFSIGLEEASWWISVTVYLLSIVIWYYILLGISENSANRFKIVLYSIFLSNLWWSLKILLFAHADGLFYIFCLLMITVLLNWGRNEKFQTWVLLSLLASLSVWIKYNGMIFLPFLAVCPVLFYGFNRKSWIGLVPIATIFPSFLFFKGLNGQVIRHLDPDREIQIISNELSWETFSSNVVDASKAINDFFFTSYISARLPRSLIVLFLIMGFALYLFLLFKWFGEKKIELVLLSFGIVYIVGIGFIFQLSNHTEMTSRTLFPVFIFYVTFLIFIFGNTIKLNKYFVGFLTLLCLLNFTRSIHGLIDWYKRAPMDSFVLVKQFKNKNSVVKTKEIVKLFNIDYNKIYTNKARDLSAVFDYEIIRTFGIEDEFQRGKVRPLEKILIEKKNRETYNDLLNEGGIIVLFDFKYPEVISNYDSIRFHYIKIEDDLIIYKR